VRPRSEAAARNLRRYPWFVGGVGFMAWMPLFLLYFLERVSLSEALALEALYYLSVVLLEVPTGYAADRWGGARALQAGAASLVVAYGLFAASGGFWGLAAAQAWLALGLAFHSGADTSFHLANLQAAGLEGEYGAREARLGALGLGVGACAALVGGALGGVGLWLAYAASGAGALVALVAAAGFAPLGRVGAGPGFGAALRGCAGALRAPRLRWLFGVAVAGTVIHHLPYELAQPWLARVGEAWWGEGATPAVAGLHLAVILGVGAAAARSSDRLAGRWGAGRLMLGALVAQAALVGCMAAWEAPWVVALLALRGAPVALQELPLRAAAAPRVEEPLRATYLSLQSLAGRLGFAGWLGVMALAEGASLRALLWMSAALAGALVGLLWWRSGGEDAQDGHHAVLGVGEDVAVGHPVADVVGAHQEPDGVPDAQVDRVLNLLERRGLAVAGEELEGQAVEVEGVLGRGEVADLQDELLVKGDLGDGDVGEALAVDEPDAGAVGALEAVEDVGVARVGAGGAGGVGPGP
jgi:hypothetical protein